MHEDQVTSMDDFRPTASLDMLRFRADLLRKVHRFFDALGFLPVETPLLSSDTVIDRHLDPLSVAVYEDPRQTQTGRTMWLQTSPEFAMKRLLAAGATAIYQVTHAFRGAETGPLHNPEFTMVEWYRVGDDMMAGMRLLADLAEHLLPFGRPRRMTYGEAFIKYAEIDPHRATLRELIRRAEQTGFAGPGERPQERDFYLDLLLVTCVEPNLGQGKPTILFDYPVSQSALAVIRDGDPPVAERFELYVRGIELANGYHELLDARQLHSRNQENNRKRHADGKSTLPEHSRMLKAMQFGLPPCAGVALGFDRLVMVASGASDISQVIAFPIDRA